MLREIRKDVQDLRTDVQDLGTDVQDLRTEVRQDVQDLRTEFRVMEGRVNSAVVVNVGAYLAPFLGFVALANSFGQTQAHLR